MLILQNFVKNGENGTIKEMLMLQMEQFSQERKKIMLLTEKFVQEELMLLQEQFGQ